MNDNLPNKKYPIRADLFMWEMSNLLSKYKVGFAYLDGLATEFRFFVGEGENKREISLEDLLDYDKDSI